MVEKLLSMYLNDQTCSKITLVIWWWL